jgi:uncharacterized protein
MIEWYVEGNGWLRRMQNDLHISKNLFVIPDNGRFILYEPRKPSVVAVNRATVQLLEAIKNENPAGIEAPSDTIRALISQGILLPRDEAHAIAFPEGGSDFNPQGVSLFLTAACSMRCIYCYSNGGDRPKQMPWPIAKAAIDWIARHVKAKAKERLHISLHGGGEVTMANDLMKRCVTYARRQVQSLGLTARIEAGLNGVMNRTTTDWVIDHINGATISLDGPPEVQNVQRPLAGGGQSFPVVAAALKRMDERGFSYGIRMTVTQEHLETLADSVAFMAANFKAQTIQVEPVFLVGRALQTGLAPVDTAMFIDRFREAKAIAGAHGIELKYSGQRFDTCTNVFCKAASGEAFGVTPEGHVTSCYEVVDADDPRADLFFFGRYHPQRAQFSFDANKIANLRRLSVEHKHYCRNCFCKWHCAGDCPAKLAVLGDAWDPGQNPRCVINRELTKDRIKELID